MTSMLRLSAQSGADGASFLGKPFLEPDDDILFVPEVVFAVADLRVRPAPEQSVMMEVVFGMIVGQDFAVESVNRVDVAGTFASAVAVAEFDVVVVVNEDCFVAVEHRE